jgi:Protein of unknown function (DUF1501)
LSTARRFIPNPTPCRRSRREFLWEVGGGFAGLALIELLTRTEFFCQSARGDEPRREAAAGAQPSLMSSKPPHFAARASRAVFLFMNGAPSQVDTFDYKPALARYHDSPYRGPTPVGSNGRPVGRLMKSPFAFRKHGQSGLEISSLFPYTARFADQLCVIRSMYTDTAAHASGCLQMNTGNVVIGKPSLGSWLSYGLGTENESLPSFVVMTDPRGGPISGASNWAAGFMPAAYQGTLFRGKGSPLLDLATPEGTSARSQRHAIDLIQELNRQHQAIHADQSELAARIQSYELAFKMQTTAAEAVDLDREDARTKAMYGLDDEQTRDFGSKCLLARRLLERGVRFIQLYSGGGHLEDTWDGHSDCTKNHTTHAGETDQPVAALLADLKRTGLWDETLVVWGGEFGRTPTSEGTNKPGRDHNPYGFSMWLAGAGVKGGQAIGATDELGFNAVENRCHVSDLHATILQLMGLDHTRLTYFYQGFDHRLTGVRGQVVKQVLV